MKVLKAALLVAAGVAMTVGLQVAAGGGMVPLRAQEAPQASQMAPTAVPTFMPSPAAVNVLNQPTVNAKQDGEWTVRLNQAPVLEVAPVRVAAPSFIHADGRYAFTWAPGTKAEQRTVLAVAADGWVLVSGTTNQAGATWLNTARAIMIEQVE